MVTVVNNARKRRLVCDHNFTAALPAKSAIRLMGSGGTPWMDRFVSESSSNDRLSRSRFQNSSRMRLVWDDVDVIPPRFTSRRYP